MEISYLKSIGSTQQHLISQLSQKHISAPYCYYTYNQTDGVGSRDNKWSGKEGNLYLSFVVKKANMPKDLKTQSYSIYFGYIFKDILTNLGSSIILKWPNDIYLDTLKIGGVITTIKSSNIICGIGLNIVQNSDKFGILDIEIDKKKLVYKFIDKILQFPKWREIFDKYSIEFYKYQNFNFHENNELKSLQDAKLNSDGSIDVDNKTIYSLR